MKRKIKSNGYINDTNLIVGGHLELGNILHY